ncbi:DUF2207 domain-containing protein [Streptomyces sp. NPDC097640]|uniref:DUF2207 domain-containing protein n=1 Tax=Streptomyces sp. NPDC097640 TaxID=3157229 RepID=UPI00331F72BE
MFLAVLLLDLIVMSAGGADPSTERVTRMWISADIAKDGSARITEVIDYDFGYQDATPNGIHLDIPIRYFGGVGRVSATEDGAPVPHELRTDGLRTRIAVGDLDRTVVGRHRYRVQYTLTGFVQDGRLVWPAIGAGWEVDRDDIEIHVVAPYDLTDARCAQDTTDSRRSCTPEKPEPGHLVVTVDKLGAGSGITLYASGARSGPASEASAPRPPSGAADGDAGVDPASTALVAAGVALCSALLVAWVLRFVGRDRLPAPLTPASAPPGDLNPIQAGILLAGRAGPWQRVAWLLDAAIAGHVAIHGGRRFTFVWRRVPGDAPVDPATEAMLDNIFLGRDEFVLSLHSQIFQSAWRILGDQLEDWRRTSGHWDPTGERRARTARRNGIVAAFVGLTVTTFGSVLNTWAHVAGWPTAVAGAVVAGTGIALWLRGWELQTRTAGGTALLLQVESYRRFVAEREADGRRSRLDAVWAVALEESAGARRVVAESRAASGAGAVGRLSTRAWYPVTALGLIAALVVAEPEQ